jgi:hypothetical protein
MFDSKHNFYKEYYLEILYISLTLQMYVVLTITPQVVDCEENSFLPLLVQITLGKI